MDRGGFERGRSRYVGRAPIPFGYGCGEILSAQQYIDAGNIWVSMDGWIGICVFSDQFIRIEIRKKQYSGGSYAL